VIAGTADGRRVAVVLAVALTVLAMVVTGALRLVGAGGSLPGGPSETERSSSPTSSAPIPDASPARSSAAAPAGGVPALGDGASGSGHGDLAPPADIEAARQTAAAFAAGWSTFRFDEPPGAALLRVRPHLTDEAAAALTASSGAAAEHERRAATHEVVTATVDGVITGGFDVDHVRLTVVVLEQVTNDVGTIPRSVAYEVSLERRDGRWLVNAVTAG
jgi:hypothetical protein